MSDADNPRLGETWAPYMDWAKSHPRPRFDLCGSNLTPASIDDLPGAREAIELNGDNDHGYAPLIDGIAAFYDIARDRVAPASGASGANFLVLAALLGPGDEVVIEKPAYDPLLGAARLLGAEVKRFERRFEDGFAVDPERVAQAIGRRTRLVVVTHPHNPSGVALDEVALEALAELADRHDVYVLVDEVYLDTLSPRPAAAATRADRLISTSSLTKCYGLAGLRAGWVLAEPAVAAAVRRVRGTVEAIGAYPAERLAHLAFEQIDALAARARAVLEPNFERLVTFVESRDELEWVRPAGGTVGFPRLRGEDDADGFVRRLLDDFDTAVVPGRLFEAPAHFRVAFGGDPEVLDGGLERIGRALDER